MGNSPPDCHRQRPDSYYSKPPQGRVDRRGRLAIILAEHAVTIAMTRGLSVEKRFQLAEALRDAADRVERRQAMPIE